jgi:dTDP-glucose 4,6-dehydratase
MHTVLITGGAGFIGSNFIPYFIRNNKDIKVVNFDNLTYAGNVNNLKEVEGNNRYTFVKGNICNRNLVENIFEKYRINGVIHFAAESHVDNSINQPDAFIKTNVFGTFNLIDVAKNFWLDEFNNCKEEFKNSRFHHISTDEVYGSLGNNGFFTEKTAYAPNNPYSASKASSDFLVRSYFHTYGLNVVTTGCSNNYGPKQHNEKLIPTIIRKAIAGENIPIYGDGKNIRDWLYVLDHCSAIELVYKQGKSGEKYNVGGNNECNNLDIATKICEILDELLPKSTSYKEQIAFVKDRLGHDYRYAIDAAKIKTELGWTATRNFEQGIVETVKWYLRKYNL